MTHQIQKHTFDFPNPLELNIPAGAVPLTIHEQNNKICLWIAVPAEGPHEKREFVVFPTGEHVPTGQGNHYAYIGTAFTGKTVWHVFEKSTVK